MAKKALDPEAAAQAEVQGARVHACRRAAARARCTASSAVPHLLREMAHAARVPGVTKARGEGVARMTMTDPIADMLTASRNANIAFHDDVVMPSSKVKERSRRSSSEGYIEATPSRTTRRARPQLTIVLKYTTDRKRTISACVGSRRRVCACYTKATDSPPRAGGHWHRHPVDEPGSHDRPRGASAPTGRRDPSATSGRSRCRALASNPSRCPPVSR
jgi:small subunit ribosomal protein S8